MLSILSNFLLFLWHRLLELLPPSVVRIIARILFLPTLGFRLLEMYLKGEDRCPWWNRVDDYVIVGAFPFQKFVNRLVLEEKVRFVFDLSFNSKVLSKNRTHFLFIL